MQQLQQFQVSLTILATKNFHQISKHSTRVSCLTLEVKNGFHLLSFCSSSNTAILFYIRFQVAQIAQVTGNGALMEDIGSQETVISSGGGGGGGGSGDGQDNANALAAAAALGITAGVSDFVGGGNPGLQHQMSVANQDLIDDDDDDIDDDNDDGEDDDDVETFNLDDVIEAVATGSLGTCYVV